MLDEKDLQAIAALMDSKIKESEDRMAGLMKVVMENEVTPKFNMLAEMLSDLKEEVDQIPKDNDRKKVIENLEVHDAVLKLHSEEIAKLKKAQ